MEVRSQEEILATLDSKGRLEQLPFMPEMLQYCGRRFRVFKRADKACDNIVGWSIRRMRNAVHLDLRCDGAAHGGCEAGCLIFWKEAWLKRVENDVVSLAPAPATGHAKPDCTLESLLAASRVSSAEGAEVVYACQATELRNFTSYMRWWDPRQYVRDVRSGNLSTGLGDESRGHRALDILLAVMRLVRGLTITVFNRGREKHQQTLYPFIVGTLEKTPIERLDLQPGELVQVRSKEEIIATLDRQNRNRGLLFDCEMLPYCGNIYRVLRRVHHIVDEKTGKMMHMKYPCIVLEGVYCQSDFHRLCPRAIYSYWREGWLKRASPKLDAPSNAEREVESCSRA
ncbi:MAG TPA: hypothetical protein VMB47_00615 [Candidatus Aquilonibacter sp.]|nr:hypothetical protein [Candidatus Aquilonibacter sp.]